MFAATLTAITPFEMILFGEDNVSLGAVIKIFRVQFFFKHGPKVS